jgi:hypothetical protein
MIAFGEADGAEIGRSIPESASPMSKAARGNLPAP